MITKGKRYKAIIAFALAIVMGLGLGACGIQGAGKSTAKVNTLQPYQMSQEEEDMYFLTNFSQGNMTVVEFAVDDSYGSVAFGYDLYVNGELAEKHKDILEIPFDSDSRADTARGKIAAASSQEGLGINVQQDNFDGGGCFENSEEEVPDAIWTSIEMEEPVDIEAGERVYFWADAMIDNGGVSSTLDDLLADKGSMKNYQMCRLFYAVFK